MTVNVQLGCFQEKWTRPWGMPGAYSKPLSLQEIPSIICGTTVPLVGRFHIQRCDFGGGLVRLAHEG